MDKEEVKETEEVTEDENTEETSEETSAEETQETAEEGAEDVFEAELEANLVEETAAELDGQFAQIMDILLDIKNMVANIGIAGPVAEEAITTTEERFNAQNEYYDDEELAEELQIND